LLQNEIYKARLKPVFSALRKDGFRAAVIENLEGAADSAVPYLTGHPTDAVLVLITGNSDDDGTSILIPWDLPMAQEYATADRLVAYTDFGRDSARALNSLLKEYGVPEGSSIETGDRIAWLTFERFRRALPGYTLVCRPEGISSVIRACRKIKDSLEIETIRRACRITDTIADEIEAGVRSGELTTESSIGSLIDRRIKELGGAGTGFESLVAAPSRSYGIHAHPPCTAASIVVPGFTIIDFGVLVDGYTSDITLTLVRGPLGPEQKTQLELVKTAYETVTAKIRPGETSRQLADTVTAIFAAAGRTMPHSLGHGIGLDAHEAPLLSIRAETEEPLLPGMIIAVEPGLYDRELGGCRWENDFLVTETGAEVLTHSRVIHL